MPASAAKAPSTRKKAAPRSARMSVPARMPPASPPKAAGREAELPVEVGETPSSKATACYPPDPCTDSSKAPVATPISLSGGWLDDLAHGLVCSSSRKWRASQMLVYSNPLGVALVASSKPQWCACTDYRRCHSGFRRFCQWYAAPQQHSCGLTPAISCGRAAASLTCHAQMLACGHGYVHDPSRAPIYYPVFKKHGVIICGLP
jgi:hypothetical protein